MRQEDSFLTGGLTRWPAQMSMSLSMSHRLQVLVSPELAARIRQAAQRQGTSTGEWVRAAVERALTTSADDPLGRLAALGAPTGDIGDMLAEIEAGVAPRSTASLR
jgi:hypothetical protein